MLFIISILYRGHKDRLTDVEGEQASRYSELSTLKIGESLESSQASKKSSSRHRRHSGSVPESVALGYGDTEGATGLENTSSENTSGHRRRSLSDSRTRSSGKSKKIHVFIYLRSKIAKLYKENSFDRENIMN